jgi:peptidoglycan/xylan/chitin deacetylase (PgdA/CDA1 family)
MGPRLLAFLLPSRIRTTTTLAWLLALSCILAACAGVRQPQPETGPRPSAVPPAGLSPQQVPLFVSFGSDDNGCSGLAGPGAAGGMHFLTELFAGRHNPAGTGSTGTFDGTPVHYSFYVNTYYIAPSADASAYGAGAREDPLWVRRAWREAVEAGHEIGNHTHSHPHGRELTIGQWEAEIWRCAEILERPYAAEEAAGSPLLPSGLGVVAGEILGFRTPFLEYSDATLVAVRTQGFAYDCSLEEGTQADQDGRNFVWPYRLNRGSPGNPAIGRHPGLWEIPVYVFMVPPDAECERFGVAPGLRARLKARQDYFDPEAGKITGMDWNLWCEYAMTPAEFLATIKYTLELRLSSNRCPLTIGLHSELYCDRQNAADCNASPADRRGALEDLVKYLQERDMVRIVSARELLQWLQHPVPLGGAA